MDANLNHWAVTVAVDGDDVLTISHNHLAGKDDLDDLDDLAPAIRTAAAHLLCFIGPGKDIVGGNVALAPSDAAQAPIYQARFSHGWLDVDPMDYEDLAGEKRIVYADPVAPAAAAPKDLLPNAMWTRHGSGSTEWWSFKGYEARKDSADQWVLRKAGEELYRHTYLQVIMAHAERAILEAAPAPAIAADAAAPSLTAEQVEQIMEQAQVFASAWSLVGGIFDHGDALDTAEAEKANLRTMLTAIQGAAQ